SCLFTGHFTKDLLNRSCIKIPDFPDQCLFFVTGGTHAESSYNCRYFYDGQLACCDIFLKFIRNFIPNTNRLFWIGLQTEKRSKHSPRSYIWSNNRGFASSRALELLDGASRRAGVGLRFPNDEDDSYVDDDEHETSDPIDAMSGRRKQCHIWNVTEGHCFYDSQGVCVRRILDRYHEADDDGQKCEARIKLSTQVIDRVTYIKCLRGEKEI
uniref:Uncharacterized protein n=1 Tax=Romanomermis culicivorax TaxID=13658 RepID=A0A915J3S9_ROMCU